MKSRNSGMFFFQQCVLSWCFALLECDCECTSSFFDVLPFVWAYPVRFLPSRFLCSRLWWQLSSTMTEAVLTPLHWVPGSYDDLGDDGDYSWVSTDAPNTFGRFPLSVLPAFILCILSCYIGDQYFLFVFFRSRSTLNVQFVPEAGIQICASFLITGFVSITLI